MIQNCRCLQCCSHGGSVNICKVVRQPNGLTLAMQQLFLKALLPHGCALVISHCSQNICVSSCYSHVPCCQCSSRVKSRFDSDFASFRLHGVQKSEPPQVSLKPKASWLRSGFLNACILPGDELGVRGRYPPKNVLPTHLF